MRGRLLFVDDECMKRRALCLEARQRGFEAEEAENARVGLQLVRESGFDAVVTDVRMPGMDGHEFLRVIKATAPETSVIIMTAYGTVASAVEAMRDGAQDYLVKPFAADELFVRLDRVMRCREAMALSRAILSGPEDAAFRRMLGRSTAMREVFSRIARVAPLPSTVLVTGESGTGKELIAEALHELSPRAGKDLVKVWRENAPKTGEAAPIPPYTLGSHASRLIELIREGHEDSRLTREEFITLVTWVDANAPYYGSYYGRRNIKYKDHPDFRPIPTIPTSRRPAVASARQ